MRVLITNDDGIDAPGLRALAAVALERAHDAYVIAPSSNNSGSSASILTVPQGRGLVLQPHSWPGWAPGTVSAVDAPPAMICRAAFQGSFGAPPDVVLSGINHGANTGRAVLHSGTVGAAFTAYQEQRPAIAMSLDVVGLVNTQQYNWATAAAIAGRLFDWLTADMRTVVLNCNVPNLPLDQLRGVRVGRLAAAGVSQTSLTQRSGQSLPVTVGVPAEGPGILNGSGPAEAAEAEPETDVGLLQRGYACVTALVPVLEDPTLELSSTLGPTVFGP